MELDGGEVGVNVGGARLASPLWCDGLAVNPGDAVLVLLSDTTTQPRAIVLGKLHTSPRPVEGLVSAVPGGGMVTVSIDDVPTDCRYVASYSPIVGDLALLLWAGGVPVVAGKASGSKPPEVVSSTSGVAPVVGGGSASSATFPAVASGTWSVSAGGWSTHYGSDAMQGTWSGRSYTGSWFYGSAPRSSAGRTVAAASIRLGSRKRVGSYNNPLSLNLYLHSNTSKGSTEPARIAGPVTVTLAPNSGPTRHDIPTAWAQQIVDSGGGISIAGGSYGGIAGRLAEPESGLLDFTWS